MRMQPVDSSVLAAVGHDRATNVLQVRFRTGRIYLSSAFPGPAITRSSPPIPLATISTHACPKQL
jgi:hypothetical protein